MEIYHSVWGVGCFSHHFYETKQVQNFYSSTSRSISGIMSVSEQGPFLFPHHTCVLRWADAFQFHSFKGLFQAPRGSEVMTPFSTHYLMECQRFHVHLWNSSKLIWAGGSWDCHSFLRGKKKRWPQLNSHPETKAAKNFRSCNVHSCLLRSVISHLWDLLSKLLDRSWHDEDSRKK